MKLFVFFAFVATVSASVSSVSLSSSDKCENPRTPLTACGNHTVPRRDPKITSAVIELQEFNAVTFYSTACGERGKKVEVDKSTSCYNIPFEPLCLTISTSCGEVSCHISVLLFVLTRLI